MKTIFDAVKNPVFPSRRMEAPNQVVEQFADRLAAKVPDKFNQHIERPQDMRPVEKSLVKEPQRQDVNSSKEGSSKKEVHTSDKRVKELEAQKKVSEEIIPLEAFFVPIVWESVELLEEELLIEEVEMLEMVDIAEPVVDLELSSSTTTSLFQVITPSIDSSPMNQMDNDAPHVLQDSVEGTVMLANLVSLPQTNEVHLESDPAYDVKSPLKGEVTEVEENPQDLLKDLNVESIKVQTHIAVKENPQIKTQELNSNNPLEGDLSLEPSGIIDVSSQNTNTDTQEFSKESKQEKTSTHIDKAPLNVETEPNATVTQTLSQETFDIEGEYLNREIVKMTSSPSAIMDQVKEALTKQLFKVGEHSEMIIKLKPEELGKLELKIEVHKESVIARFSVESQVVKEAIESNLSDLRNSLKDKGFSDMTFDVNVSKEREGHQNSNPNSYKRVRRIKGIDISLERVEATYQKTLVSLIGNSQFEHLG